jgi:hypothetical protein
MFFSGFFFLSILVLGIAMAKLGHVLGLGDYDADAELQKINEYPKRFKWGIRLALIERACVITLPIMLFITFSQYNIILGIIWVTVRIGEGLIQFNNERNYWKLLNIARQYSASGGAKKKSLSDLGLDILQTKHSRFTFAMVLFSIGTLSYSILFVIYEVAPPFIGWLGIAVGITFGFGSGIMLVKPNFKILVALGGLLTMIFEVSIGVFLVYYSFIIP